MTQLPQDAPRPQKTLPAQSCLAHLAGQAKQLLKAHRDQDRSAAERVAQHHPQYVGLPPVEIFSKPLPLTHAQTVIAREYGFASWPALKRHVEHAVPDAFIAFPQDIDIQCELETDGRGRLLKTVVVAGMAYNYGDICQTVQRLEDSSPDRTVRLQGDPAVRALLLWHGVIAATDAYPSEHRWCRFHRAPGFAACRSALDRAQEALEERDPRKPGQHWFFSPSVVAAVPEEKDIHEVAITEDEDEGNVQLLMGEMDTPYPLFMTPFQAEDLGTGLAALVFSASHPDDADTPPLACDTDMEEVFLGLNRGLGRIEIWAEDWDAEDARLLLSVAQADEISWQLREAAARQSHSAPAHEKRSAGGGSGEADEVLYGQGGDSEYDMFGPEVLLFRPYCPTCDVTYLFRYESLPGFREHNVLPCPGCSGELGIVDSAPVLLRQAAGQVEDAVFDGWNG